VSSLRSVRAACGTSCASGCGGARRRMGACCSRGDAEGAAPGSAAPNSVVDELDIKTLAAETHCALPSGCAWRDRAAR
jgi:hypothetical protein